MAQRCFWCLKQHFRFASWATGTDIPRITVPHVMMRKIERKKLIGAVKEYQNKKKGPVIISCKNSQFNHHFGQTYANFKPEYLASRNWKNRKSKGDYFTINAFRRNPALELPDGIASFTDLDLNKNIVSGIESLGVSRPTNIQALAIPIILEGKNVLCAAETGSGKTFAYLLPVLQRIHQYKINCGPLESYNEPHAVIVMPSRELADQVFDVATELCNHLGLKVHSVCGGRGTQIFLRNPPEAPVDVLIATPGVLSKLLTNRIYSNERLACIVLDEADTLFDDSFNNLTLRIVRKLKIVSEKLSADDEIVGTQLVMVGATVPRSLENIMEDIVPMNTIHRIITNHTHRLMPHVVQKFYRCLPSVKHEELILQLLKLRQKKQVEPVIIFCNRTSTSHFVANLLTDHDILYIHLHGGMKQEYREGRFQQFQECRVNVMVATDIASRGLDTRRAKHIINYEFPDFMSDYIHRVGRVGRVGSETGGIVHSYISHAWEVDLLWKIETAARRITELHNVNANIKRKLQAMAEAKQLDMKLQSEQGVVV